MEAIAMLVLLSLGVAVVSVIWLVVRSVIARDQIQELTRRVDDLQMELYELKVSAAAPKSVAEKIAGFSPAPAAPLQASVTITPQTVAPAAPPPVVPQVKPAAVSVVPPRPPVAEPLLVKPIQAAPVIRSALSEALPASPAIPPQTEIPKASPIIPPMVPPMPEPVLARAQSAEMDSAARGC